MPTASGEYTMRAQPRRRKESASRGDEPVFLRKTYDMINSCDQTLAGWSAKGDTFVIKDPDRFAAEVIPTFFKHSKFSSFVRQLNFYGFRKVKALDGRDAAAAAGWWEFKHDLFTRATPHLIAEIKRATHYVAPPEAEVDALRTEVTTLTERMLAMDARIAALSALVDELRAQPSAAAAAAVAAAPAAAVPSKRRRVDGDASATAAAEEMAAAFGGGGGAMDAMLPPLPQTPGVKPELLFDVVAQEPVADEAELLRTMSLASVDTNASFFDPDLFDSFGLADGSGGAGGLEFMDFDAVDESMPPVSAAFDGMVAAGGSAQQEAAATLLSASTTHPAPAWELGDGATTPAAVAAAAAAEESAAPAPAAADTSAPAAAVAEAAEQAADLAQSLSALPGDAQAKLAEGVLALLRHQSAAAAGGGAASDAAAPALSKATAAAAAAMAPPAAAALLPGAPEIAMPLASAALGAFLTHFAHRRGGMQSSLVRTLSTQSAASVATPLLHAPVV